MKRFIIVILLLMCFVAHNINAEEWMGIKYQKTPNWDIWSLSHMVGGIGGQWIFTKIGIHPKAAVICTSLFGIYYEIFCDGLGVKIPLFHDIHGIDPRGADLLGDAIWVGFGAYLEYRLNKITPSANKVSFRFGRNQIGLAFNL